MSGPLVPWHDEVVTSLQSTTVVLVPPFGAANANPPASSIAEAIATNTIRVFLIVNLPFLKEAEEERAGAITSLCACSCYPFRKGRARQARLKLTNAASLASCD